MGRGRLHKTLPSMRTIQNPRAVALSLRTEYDMSIREIAKECGKSTSTIHKWLAQPNSSSRVGAPKYLTDDEEFTLCGIITQKAVTKGPCDAAELCEEAFTLASKRACPPADPPTRGWAKSFLLRHPDLAFKKPVTVEPERAEACTEANLRPWFDSMESQIDPKAKFSDSRFVFNMDETMLNVTNSKTKVIVPKEMKKAVKIDPKKPNFHITLVLCVCADGTALKTTAILDSKYIPSNICEEEFAMFFWSGSASGWITEDIFESWVDKVFIPHIKEKRAQCKVAEDTPVLLWLDGHASRGSGNTCRAFIDNHVTCAVIPGHTSHILQPLDCGVNSAFKKSLNKKKHLFSTKTNTPETRKAMLIAAHAALHEACYSGTIKTAWRVAGLFPWAPESVLSDKSKVEPNQDNSKPSFRSCKISGTILSSEEAASKFDEIKRKKEAEKARKGSKPKKTQKQKSKPKASEPEQK